MVWILTYPHHFQNIYKLFFCFLFCEAKSYWFIKWRSLRFPPYSISESLSWYQIKKSSKCCPLNWLYMCSDRTEIAHFLFDLRIYYLIVSMIEIGQNLEFCFINLTLKNGFAIDWQWNFRKLLFLVLGKLDSCTWENEIREFYHTKGKSSVWIKNLSVRLETLKYLKENMKHSLT